MTLSRRGSPVTMRLDFMREAGKLAVAGNAELSTSTDLLTSALNAFNLEADQAEMVSDIMFNTVKMGKTTVDELGQSFSNMGPVMSAMNVDLEEGMAWLARLTLSGTPTAEATTQIRAALSDLGKDGSKAFKHFEKAAGQTFPEFMAAGGTLEEVFQHLTDYSERTGVAVFDMFGRVQAGQAVLQVTGGNLDGFAESMIQMGESAGSTEEAFELMSAGVDFQLRQLRETFNAVKENVGTVLLPALSRVLPRVTDLVGKVADADLDGFFKRIADHIDRQVTPRVNTVRTVLRGWYNNLLDFGRQAVTVGRHVRGIAAARFDHLTALAALRFDNLQITVDAAVGDVWEQVKAKYEESIPADTRAAIEGAVARLAGSFREDWDQLMTVPDVLSDAWTAAQKGDFTEAGRLLGQAFYAVFDFLKIHDNLIEAITGKTPSEWAQAWIPGLTEAIEAAAGEEDWTGKFTAFFTAMFAEWKKEWDETIYPKVAEVWATITDWFAGDGAVTTAWNAVRGWLTRTFADENVQQAGVQGGKVSAEILSGMWNWFTSASTSEFTSAMYRWVWKAASEAVLGVGQLPKVAVNLMSGIASGMIAWMRDEENTRPLNTSFVDLAKGWGDDTTTTFESLIKNMFFGLPAAMAEWGYANIPNFYRTVENWGSEAAANLLNAMRPAMNTVIRTLNDIIAAYNWLVPAGWRADELAEIARFRPVKKTIVTNLDMDFTDNKGNPYNRPDQYRHSGGMVHRSGLFNLEAGEQVLTARQQAAAGGGGGFTVNGDINISVDGGTLERMDLMEAGQFILDSIREVSRMEGRGSVDTAIAGVA